MKGRTLVGVAVGATAVGHLFALSCVLIAQPAFSFPSYQSRIPNGDKVKDGQGNAWPGVGHKQRGGGSWRNVFGQDFLAAGKKWTTALCQKDSDCDGKTNGYVHVQIDRPGRLELARLKTLLPHPKRGARRPWLLLDRGRGPYCHHEYHPPWICRHA